MKAIRYYQYGGPEVIHLEDVSIPEPGPGEVLVHVKAAALNPLDWRMVRAEPVMVRPYSGIFKPKKPGLGGDLAGVVEKCGDGATQFSAGEAVMGTVFPGDLGSLAEYVVVKEESIVSKPNALSYQDASTFGVAALTALQGIEKYIQLNTSSRVLINGASGGVGTFAVQIAKASGAHVTAISSKKNHELVHSLGADETICYKETAIESLSIEPFDLIFDAVGTYSPKQLRGHLKPNGQLVYASAKNSWGFISRIIADKRESNLHMIVDLDKGQKELNRLLTLYTSSKMKAVIDRTYALEQTPEALAYLETMRARGKVVVTVTE